MATGCIGKNIDLAIAVAFLATAMVVPASLLVIVTSYYPHHAKLQTSSTNKIGGQST